MTTRTLPSCPDRRRWNRRKAGAGQYGPRTHCSLPAVLSAVLLAVAPAVAPAVLLVKLVTKLAGKLRKAAMAGAWSWDPSRCSQPTPPQTPTSTTTPFPPMFITAPSTLSTASRPWMTKSLQIWTRRNPREWTHPRFSTRFSVFPGFAEAQSFSLAMAMARPSVLLVPPRRTLESPAAHRRLGSALR